MSESSDISKDPMVAASPVTPHYLSESESERVANQVKRAQDFVLKSSQEIHAGDPWTALTPEQQSRYDIDSRERFLAVQNDGGSVGPIEGLLAEEDNPWHYEIEWRKPGRVARIRRWLHGIFYDL